jgi:HEAT repeat protein
MKRLMVLVLGCSLLVLGAWDGGVFGQKDKGGLNIPKKEELPKLIEQLKDKDANARMRAATLLGNFGQIQAKPVAGAVSTLLTIVKSDENADCRRAAADAIGKIASDPKGMVPVLVEALKNDKEFSVKIAAANALGTMGPEGKSAIPALQEAQAIAKGAAKDEKDKQALGKAAGGALKLLKSQ